jgi:hypothetical protein
VSGVDGRPGRLVGGPGGVGKRTGRLEGRGGPTAPLLTAHTSERVRTPVAPASAGGRPAPVARSPHPSRSRQALDTLETLWVSANGRAVAGGALAAAAAAAAAAPGGGAAAAGACPASGGGTGAVSELDCVACFREPRNTRLRPCCHVLLCRECAREAMARDPRCPGCSAPVVRFDAGFFESEDPAAAAQ